MTEEEEEVEVEDVGVEVVEEEEVEEVEEVGVICVAGFETCVFHQQALALARELVEDGRVGRLVDKTFPSREAFRDWILGGQGGRRQGRMHGRCPREFASWRRPIGGITAPTSTLSRPLPL